MRRVPDIRNGFTLVELLVVVVILAIMASTMGLAAGENAEQKLDLGQIRVEDAVARAQALAFSTRAPHAVVFDPAGERFTIVDETGEPLQDTLTRRKLLVDLDHPSQALHLQIEAVDFGAAGAAIIFDAQGAPMTGGTVSLRYKDTVRTLTVDPATGRVTGG